MTRARDSATNSHVATFVHPTGSGNNHIPTGGATDQILTYASAGTAAWADPASGGGGGASVHTLINTTKITSSTTSITVTGIDPKYSMIFVDYSLQGPTSWGSAKLTLGVNGVFSSSGEYTTGSNTLSQMQLDGGWAREQNAGRVRIHNLGSSTKTIIVSRHIEIEAQASPTWLSDAQNEFFTRNTTQYNSIRIAGLYGGTGYSSGYMHVYGIADS